MVDRYIASRCVVILSCLVADFIGLAYILSGAYPIVHAIYNPYLSVISYPSYIYFQTCRTASHHLPDSLYCPQYSY